jgi:hypothetical protein
VIVIALWWITVISSESLNQSSEALPGIIDAVMGETVGVAVPVPDVVGGGGGVYP